MKHIKCEAYTKMSKVIEQGNDERYLAQPVDVACRSVLGDIPWEFGTIYTSKYIKTYK